MARHAPDNKTTSAVNRTPAFKVSTAWDVAGDASEHAATIVRSRRACAWQIETGGRRIDVSKHFYDGLGIETLVLASCC